jgi:uncharacterized RDD family membrane protein YckC
MLCQNHIDVTEGVRSCARCGVSYCGDCLVTIGGQLYCAVCKNEKVMDVQSGTDASTLQLATIGRRAGAIIIDNMVVGIPAWILLVVLMVALMPMMKGGGEMALGFLFIAVGLLVFVAFVAYEALMISRNGQTLGKMALRIRVVRPDGSPISAGQAWGRASIRVVLIHVLMLLNYIPAFVTKEKTCLHDMVAKTRVVQAD